MMNKERYHAEQSIILRGWAPDTRKSHPMLRLVACVQHKSSLKDSLVYNMCVFKHYID